MADGFNAKDAAGNSIPILVDEVVDGTLGTAQKQLVGIVDATINGTNKLIVNANGRIGVEQPLGGGQTLQQGVINVAASGNTTLVAAQGAAKVIYVVSMRFVVSGAVVVQFKSATTTNLTGPESYAANDGVVDNGSITSPIFWTNANEALTINLGGAVQCSGRYTYYVV